MYEIVISIKNDRFADSSAEMEFRDLLLKMGADCHFDSYLLPAGSDTLDLLLWMLAPDEDEDWLEVTISPDNNSPCQLH